LCREFQKKRIGYPYPEKEQSEKHLSDITEGMVACEVIALLKPFFPRSPGVSHQNLASSINQL
jgi:hypothetical protein